MDNGNSAVIEEGGSVNPYISEIEKRKRKYRLAHEHGAGSKCLNCKDQCPGLDLHFWRKICKECKCKPEAHAIPEDDEPSLVRIGSLFESSPFKSRLEEALTAHGVSDAHHGSGDGAVKRYAWVPRGLPPEKVSDFMERLPEAQRPLLDTVGVQNRREAIEKQLPLYDFKPETCHNLSQPEVESQTTYLSHLQQIVGIGVVSEPEIVEKVIKTPMFQNGAAAGQADESTTRSSLSGSPEGSALSESSNALVKSSEYVKSNWQCRGCAEPMVGGETAVFAERVGVNVCWHPNCFTCFTCKQPLVDLIYFFKQETGNIYCGRHYGESYYLRCAGCDELIFSKEYTQAEKKNWHVKHFCCFNCDKELGGLRYMFKENAPFCLDCYADKFAKECRTCLKKIQADFARISHNDMNWHADAKCFHCCQCRKSLLNSRFIVKYNEVFCTSDCKSAYAKANPSKLKQKD